MNIYTLPKPYKSRYLIEEKIASILIDSYYAPINQSSNGAFFIDNFHFAANIKILCQRLGINPNSLCKDFRYHKIQYLHKLPAELAKNLFDPKGWKIYKHSNNCFSLENVLKGSTRLTTKWDKKAKKLISNKTNEEEQMLNHQDEQKNHQKSLNIKEKGSIVSNKIHSSKLCNTSEHYFEDDDENYIYFLS